jgi:hypothetical protein
MNNKSAKSKTFILLMLLFFGPFCFRASAQGMIVMMKDGTENTKAISSLLNFTFSGSDLLLKLINKTSENYTVTDIRKIFFDPTYTNPDSTDGSDDSDSTNIDNPGDTDQDSTITAISESSLKKLSIYPNPVEYQLFLKNVPETSSAIKIYRMDGVVVMLLRETAGISSIDISELPSGFYLLRIDSQTVKFIKK